jgi:dihydroorotate dehydrogenase
LAAIHGKRRPLLLKIAPDLDETELDAIATAVLAAGIDGVVCTNTTVERAAVAGHRHAGEAGGLSGAPLFQRSTAVLAGMRQRLGEDVPLVGVGGILEGADAAAKLRAGAALVQFYSGMVYRGPALVGECVEAMRGHV